MPRKRIRTEPLPLVFPESAENSRLKDENSRLIAENERLQVQVVSLRDEINRLQRLITRAGSKGDGQNTDALPPKSTAGTNADGWDRLVHPSPSVTRKSPIKEKIALFRSYFKGRDDVYALRGKERNGRGPYYPQRHYARGRTGETIGDEYIPLTDDVIRAHLTDERHPVVGIYPLLLDETCWFLAIDFDKRCWKENALAVLSTCQELNIPAALERSRSGEGAHIWVFFYEPIPAKTARALGTVVLTRTLKKHREIGLDSYDRMFPNQDTLPQNKKLGNLIALPLQRLAGEAGNSLFVDEGLNRYPDQWVYLSTLRKMRMEEVEAVVREAKTWRYALGPTGMSGQDQSEDGSRSHSIKPAMVAIPDEFPDPLHVVLSNMLFIQKANLNSAHINFFRSFASFSNPEFYKAQAMRLSTYNKPRIIDCSDERPDCIALPRGCYDEITETLRQRGIEIVMDDGRNRGSKIEIEFKGHLHEEQRVAVDELLAHDIGTLSATTAFGKTVVALWMMAARGVNTLILVHRTQLMEQWRQRLSVFLEIPIDEIGIIGGGKTTRTGRIDIALIQSLHVNHEVKGFVEEYGHVIVDECHHISANSFEQVLKRVRARYVLGLTATLTRKDGKHPIVVMQCGPVRYRADAKSQAKNRPFTHVVKLRHTGFEIGDNEPNMTIQHVYDRIVADEERNDMIFNDLLLALNEGRCPILLTDRRAHLEYFEARLKGFAKNIIVLRGGMGKKQLRMAQEKLRAVPRGEERVILATGRFIGEGFDDDRLDTLFLVMPISWKGTLQQYAGRLHRLYNGKDEVQIYDYVDDGVPMLLRMYQKRLMGYRAMGYVERNP